MNKWAMNLSKDEYEKYIHKKNFVNEYMSYRIQTVTLPNDRVMVQLFIDVFAIVPTITAIKCFLNYDISIIPSFEIDSEIDINQRLQLKGIGDTIYTSYSWLPNVADYSLAPIRNLEASNAYFEFILNNIPKDETLLLAQELDPVVGNNTLDYQLIHHNFSVLILGLLDVLKSYPEKAQDLIKQKIALTLVLKSDIARIIQSNIK